MCHQPRTCNTTWMCWLSCRLWSSLSQHWLCTRVRFWNALSPTLSNLKKALLQSCHGPEHSKVTPSKLYWKQAACTDNIWEAPANIVEARTLTNASHSVVPHLYVHTYVFVFNSGWRKKSLAAALFLKYLSEVLKWALFLKSDVFCCCLWICACIQTYVHRERETIFIT